jgi:hypothetical protein
MRITERSGARVRCRTPLRHDESLARTQCNDSTRSHSVRLRLEIDQEPAIEHEEELVVIRVLVPVILALHHADAHDRLVHLDQSLIVPLIANRGDERIELDLLERIEQNVQMRCVREL